MIEQLQASLTEATENSIALRFEFSIPGFGAEATELNRSLVEVQDFLSQLERYLSQSMRAKAVVDRRVASARMIWQEAWDRAISKPSKRMTLTEYATGKEKAAEANLAAFNEAHTLRQEEELQTFAVEAVDVIRLHYYGLDKIRQDIRKRLDMSQTDYYS